MILFSNDMFALMQPPVWAVSKCVQAELIERMGIDLATVGRPAVVVPQPFNAANTAMLMMLELIHDHC